MDLFTLSVCTVILSFMMTVTLTALYVTSKHEVALRDWAIAGACFFISAGCILLTEHTSLPWFFTPVLSNTLYVAAHGFLLSGFTHHTRSVNSYLTVALFATMVFLLHFLEPLHQNVNIRLLAFFPVIIVLTLLSLSNLWRFRRTPSGRSFWPAMFMMALFSFHALVNALMVMFFPEQLTFLGDDILQTTNTLVAMLYIIGITLSLCLIHAWKREHLLSTMSRTDALTQWFNRHALNEYASREFSRCQRNHESFAFIVFDIDHFKQVNDKYGHAVGDTALQHVAVIAKEATREYDFHFRLGGEEFVIMVTGLRVSDIKTVAERVRHAIEQTPCFAGNEVLSLSVSVGLAMTENGDLNWQIILDRADRALYAAKKAGRNKTHLLTESGLSLVKA